MESKISKEAEQALIETMKRLTPEERLNAFLELCQRTMECDETAERLRAASKENARLRRHKLSWES